ncbi:MAG: ABC transporter substrate-binding protein [Rhodospirillales bacterium]|nr:ABC transporter substrate-binding protein [Rhodospirillales bacterium]
MQRRHLLRGAAVAAGAAALPRLAIAQKAQKPLIFVPTADLSSLDPIWTTTQTVQNHGYYVFDTLYGVDGHLGVHPQMAEGHEISPDGRIWRIKLRDGLKFHDGEPVLARDCAASLKRWCQRDVLGQTTASFVDTWGTDGDRVIKITLKSPFPLLSFALGKPNGMVPFIMPERIAANTDPNAQITEVVGSGPYRFLKEAFVPGGGAEYVKFDAYVPRKEKPDWTAGGKVAHIERIHWRVIADTSTQAAALQAGEVDWLEQVQPDLLPLLRKRKDLHVGATNPIGYFGVLRFNSLHPPFNNPAIKRAVLRGLSQDDYMQAVTSGEPNAYRHCKALFTCGLPYGQEIGAPLMTGDLDAARAELKAAGYAGEKVVILNPADVPSISPFGHVTRDYFIKLGLNVEFVDTDWGTLVQRRGNKNAPDQGGWSVFHTWWIGTSVANPALSTIIRGLGAKGWAGWFTDEKIEALTGEWLVASDEKDRLRLADAIQKQAFDTVPTAPLGQFTINTAYRKALTGMVEGTSPYPWGLRWT